MRATGVTPPISRRDALSALAAAVAALTAAFAVGVVVLRGALRRPQTGSPDPHGPAGAAPRCCP